MILKKDEGKTLIARFRVSSANRYIMHYECMGPMLFELGFTLKSDLCLWSKLMNAWQLSFIIIVTNSTGRLGGEREEEGETIINMNIEHQNQSNMNFV